MHHMPPVYFLDSPPTLFANSMLDHALPALCPSKDSCTYRTSSLVHHRDNTSPAHTERND
jgi:hypothetical protein